MLSCFPSKLIKSFKVRHGSLKFFWSACVGVCVGVGVGVGVSACVRTCVGVGVSACVHTCVGLLNWLVQKGVLTSACVCSHACGIEREREEGKREIDRV